MPGISKRTAYYDIVYNRETGIPTLRPSDWCLVITDLGPMMEPTVAFTRKSFCTPPIEVDFTDMMAMVNDIQMSDTVREKQIAGDTVHGGSMMPRSGR